MTGPGVRVLVVDDEPGMVDLITVLLKDTGWQVEVASTGRSALERAPDEARRHGASDRAKVESRLGLCDDPVVGRHERDRVSVEADEPQVHGPTSASSIARRTRAYRSLGASTSAWVALPGRSTRIDAMPTSAQSRCLP